MTDFDNPQTLGENFSRATRLWRAQGLRLWCLFTVAGSLWSVGFGFAFVWGLRRLMSCFNFRTGEFFLAHAWPILPALVGLVFAFYVLQAVVVGAAAALLPAHGDRHASSLMAAWRGGFAAFGENFRRVFFFSVPFLGLALLSGVITTAWLQAAFVGPHAAAPPLAGLTAASAAVAWVGYVLFMLVIAALTDDASGSARFLARRARAKARVHKAQFLAITAAWGAVFFAVRLGLVTLDTVLPSTTAPLRLEQLIFPQSMQALGFTLFLKVLSAEPIWMPIARACVHATVVALVTSYFVCVVTTWYAGPRDR